MDLSMLAAITAIVALPTSLLLWMMSKLHNDITGLTNRLEANQIAINARVDSMQQSLSQRIDQTQEIIMRMVQKELK